MIARLIVVRGPDKGQVFELPHGFSGQLGRGADAELKLTDATVSRVHCHLEHDAEGLMVVNLSQRHTLLDGRPITNFFHVTDR
jgi:predicted component of type VI protein secretion system